MNVCILWKGAVSSNGYGVTSMNGKLVGVHRKEWILNRGEIPAGYDVCHKCDNRSCYNIQHLFLGTRKENMEDCVAKGRIARGEKLPQTVLDEFKVRQIRLMASEGIPQSKLANLYGVHYNTINFIVRRINWRHVL